MDNNKFNFCDEDSLDEECYAGTIDLAGNNYVRGIEDYKYYKVDKCFMALIDDTACDKFLRYIQSDVYEDANKLLESFKKLIDFFKNIGYQFNALEKKRVNLITGILVESKANVSNEEIIEANKISTFLKLISDNEFYYTYLHAKDTDKMNGIDKEYIENHLIDDLRKYKIFPGNFDDSLKGKMERFLLLDMLRKGKYAYIPNDIVIDKEFEEKIIGDIDPNLVDEDVAYEIYYRLNKYTKFCPKQFTMFSDDDYLFIGENAEDVSIDHNNVTCKSWSELYYYFINKYTNLKACIVGMKDVDVYHKYVAMFTNDGRCISADGTNIIYDDRNKTYMCDMARVNFGLSLKNFGPYFKLKCDNKFKFDFDKEEYDRDMEFYRIVSLIGNDKAKSMMHDVFDRNFDNMTIGKFRVICQIINDYKNVDNVSLHSLCKNLLNICFDENERKTVKFNDLYTDELSDCPYILSYSILNANEEYEHYLFDSNKGFYQVDSELLRDLLLTGRLKKVDTTKKIIGLDSMNVK